MLASYNLIWLLIFILHSYHFAWIDRWSVSSLKLHYVDEWGWRQMWPVFLPFHSRRFFLSDFTWTNLLFKYSSFITIEKWNVMCCHGVAFHKLQDVIHSLSTTNGVNLYCPFNFLNRRFRWLTTFTCVFKKS